MTDKPEQLSFDPLNTTHEDQDFEKNMKALEALLAKLEQGDLPLSESIACFEQGYKLSKMCQKQLSEMEERIKKIAMNEGGEIEELPFDI